MSGTSGNTVMQGCLQEYVVKAPRTSKRFTMMKFSSTPCVDFKKWTDAKLERENNALTKQYHGNAMPKLGAGSVFGREVKIEALRKRRERVYQYANQPWILTVGGRGGKKFKGTLEGGVSDNSSWFIFMQGKDGSFEAYPVEEWYNYKSIGCYKSLSEEEAENHFKRRKKIVNYHFLMKKSKQCAEKEEDNSKIMPYSSGLTLSELDDWMSADSSDNEEVEGSDDDTPKKKKYKVSSKARMKKGGKNLKNQDGVTDDECIEESDEFDDGAEHDYISSDSSDSEAENDEVVRRELAGVDEANALRKLLCSDEEDEDEDEDKQKDDKKNEENKEKEPKNKRSKKSDKKGVKTTNNKDNNRDANDNVVTFERDSDKGAKDSFVAFEEDIGVTEQSIRRYLMRKPITTTELLQKFKMKKTGLNPDQLVTSIAKILKKINPLKQMVKGKLYLSLQR